MPYGVLVPNRDILIDQGNQTFVTSGTTLAQPLTQLIRVRQANRMAAAEIAARRHELTKAENQVAREGASTVLRNYGSSPSKARC